MYLLTNAIPDTISRIMTARHLQTSGVLHVCVQIGFSLGFLRKKNKMQRNKIPLLFQTARATFSRKLQTYDSENSFSPFLDLPSSAMMQRKIKNMSDPILGATFPTIFFRDYRRILPSRIKEVEVAAFLQPIRIALFEHIHPTILTLFLSFTILRSPPFSLDPVIPVKCNTHD